MINHKQVTELLLKYFPDLQAVYIFGSQSFSENPTNSDVWILQYYFLPKIVGKQSQHIFIRFVLSLSQT